MKILFVFLLTFSAVGDAVSSMDRKKGFAIGAGMNLGLYSFPVQFEGQTKNKIDEKATIIGPSLQLGYDLLLWNRLLLGLRSEAMLADTAGMNKDKSKKITSQTNGKSHSLNGTLRLGFVREFLANNPVGETYPMIFELFAEAGIGSGRNDFILDYNYSFSGVSELYKEEIQETFQSRVLSAGMNLTSISGSFFELKVMQTSFESNSIQRSGSYTVNGGGPVTIAAKDKNTDPAALTTFFMIIGHHY
jgi:hypothetical protein